MTRHACLFLLLPGLLFPASSVAQIRQESLSLNGTNQYLSVSNKTDLENLSAMTIEAWVYPTTFAGAPTIVGNDFQNSYWFGLSSAGRPRFYPAGAGFFDAAPSIPLNAWTHLAVTFSGATGKVVVYIDGVAVDSTTGLGASTGSSAGDLRIGADRFGVNPNFFFSGYLDEVRIWNVARKAPDIASMRFERVNNPGFGGTTYQGLLAYWDMEDPWPSPPDRHLDRVGGFGMAANDAFFVNAPPTSLEAPPVSYNAAIQFDGVDDYVYRSMPDGFSEGLTIEAWVCPLSFAGYPTIVGRGFETSFWLGFNTDGHLRFYPTGGFFNYVESPFALHAGTWYHVAATYRDGVAQLMIDGLPPYAFTSISGPVGENGRDVYVGADNGNSGSEYHFTGIIDHVTITRGEVPMPTIRKAMAYTISAPFGMTPDLYGTPRERIEMDLGHRNVTRMSGNPRFVQGQTPRVAFGITSPLWETDVFYGYHHRVEGARPLYLFLGDDLFVPQSETITSMKVFVSVPAEDLSAFSIELRHPDLTWITLLDTGEARGREIHTVFDDAAVATIAASYPPYDRPVKPFEPLSTFNGKSSFGSWRMGVTGTGPLGGWSAWALSFNGVTPVSAGPAGAPARAALELAGAHPVRGAGRMVLSLPRAGRARLELLDVQGRRVRALLDGRFDAGRTIVHWNAAGLEPGAYVARLEVEGEAPVSAKVIVVR